MRINGVIYEFVSNNIPSFWRISLNGFEFIFLLRDSENDLFLGCTSRKWKHKSLTI